MATMVSWLKFPTKERLSIPRSSLSLILLPLLLLILSQLRLLSIPHQLPLPLHHIPLRLPLLLLTGIKTAIFTSDILYIVKSFIKNN